MPLVDLPGHMARIHIAMHYAELTQWQQLYEGWQPWVPNQAIDRIVPPLMTFLPAPAAARAFTGIFLVVFALGCWLLERAFYGNNGWGAAFALFAAYNSLFFYGFVNYEFSVAACFVGLALWWMFRQQWTVLRWISIALLICGVYFSHLGGFIFLGLSVAVLCLFDLRKQPLSTVWKQWAQDAIPFIPAAALYLQRPAGPAQGVEWGPFRDKAIHAMITLIGYDRRVDVVVVVTLAAAASIAAKKGRVSIHPQLAALAAVFWLCFLAFPDTMMTGTAADTRFVLPGTVFSVLAVRFALPLRWARSLLLVSFCALLLRVASIGVYWHSAGPRIADQVEFLSSLPPGARLYGIFWPASQKEDLPLKGILSYAANTRDVVTRTFATKSQNIIWAREELWYEDYNDRPNSPAPKWAKISSEFEYVWAYKVAPSMQRELDSRYVLIGARDGGRLYRIPR